MEKFFDCLSDLFELEFGVMRVLVTVANFKPIAAATTSKVPTRTLDL
jgi:hypothetical protein